MTETQEPTPFDDTPPDLDQGHQWADFPDPAYGEADDSEAAPVDGEDVDEDTLYDEGEPDEGALA